MTLPKGYISKRSEEMKDICEKKSCTGCTACMNNCPKKAIKMENNSEGFLYPVIDEHKCINCGLCKKICPVLNTKEKKSLNKCYVGYIKDNETIMDSSSGGIFYLLAIKVLEENGVVIGAAFNKKHELNHIAIEKKQEIKELMGSKYLQSNLNNIFDYVKNVINKRKILFVGTPCQVAGLKSFLKKEYENLITIDLICHGAPSQKMFQKYIEYLEKENSDKLVTYNFRDKSTGWDTYSNEAKFKNKEIKELSTKNYYMGLFLSNNALRESCYNCNFKLGNKYSDITLGDFWGIKNYHKEMYNRKGTSAIIINTKKGEEVFTSINNALIYKECEIEEIVGGNPSLKYSSKRPKNRTKFYNDIDYLEFNTLYNIYKPKKASIVKRCINKLKMIIKYEK